VSENSEREDHQEQVAEIGISGHIGEGFDDARLDTLFLALPISWRAGCCVKIEKCDDIAGCCPDKATGK
jgi:hypothetical protein